jgi:hypothetical protein
MDKYLEKLQSELIEEQLMKEMSYYTAPDVQQILDNTPSVTKKEMVAQAQPGDVMVAFTATKTIRDSWGAKLFAKLMATFQGSPYTSSKMVMADGSVAGYGVTIRKEYAGNVIDKVPIAEAVRARGEICLIRVADASPAQRKKAVQFVKSKMGLGYSDLDLYKSIWNRLTKRKFLPFFKDKTLNKEQLQSIQEPLFCSTLITVAYHVAGYRKRFNNMHPYDVWPKDFILADNTEKLCRIEY